jgi:hypothetical protein
MYNVYTLHAVAISKFRTTLSLLVHAFFRCCWVLLLSYVIIVYKEFASNGNTQETLVAICKQHAITLPS